MLTPKDRTPDDARAHFGVCMQDVLDIVAATMEGSDGPEVDGQIIHGTWPYIHECHWDAALFLLTSVLHSGGYDAQGTREWGVVVAVEPLTWPQHD